MLKYERFEFILEKLHAGHTVNAASLSEELQISEATVRRDLTELDALGRVRKVHGGAILAAHPVLTFQERAQVHQEVKFKMAQKALSLLHHGQLIMIDGGTTNLHLVKLIPADFQATVITNSPTIAQQFHRHPDVLVMMTGGEYLKSKDVLVGVPACETINSMYADVCLLGICSLHPVQGVTVGSHEEAFVKKAMIRSSLCVIALTHAEKLGQCENFRVCDAEQLDVLITELNPEAPELLPYQNMTIQIV